LRVKDHLKNKAIEELSRSSTNALYRIDSEAQKVVINREWFEYIYGNQIIINGWYYFKLISFLQQRNPNIPSIPFKLDVPRERNLGGARKFWHKVMKVCPVEDIYTGRRIEPKSFSIDHFIPWSFVLHDQLWNLVPTSKSVNSSKNDRLPDMDRYLDKFCDLHFAAYRAAFDNGISMRLLEDYIEVLRDISFSRDVGSVEFKGRLKESIRPLFQLASNQGYQVWENGGI
ncbi:MAG: HNH endonuclease, partial [bacterium]|nr:HNH endonuclease [bacterium]